MLVKSEEKNEVLSIFAASFVLARPRQSTVRTDSGSPLPRASSTT